MPIKHTLDDLVNKWTSYNPWTNVYGMARSILALGTFITISFNDVNTLFRPALGIDFYPICIGVGENISLFCLLSNNLIIAKYVALFVLGLVISGWRPRVTGIFHWWISFSLVSSAIIIDGGDHVTAVLSLLLIPITLLDNRKWHWSNVESDVDGIKRIVFSSTHLVIRLQVSIIYLNAAVSKTSVVEWMNGTACYYWFTDPTFGLTSWLQPIFNPIIQNSFTVSFLTWGVIIFEFALFIALVANKKSFSYFLVIGLFFHFFIAIIHGLVSFFFAMAGALILYLSPIEKPFRIEKKISTLKKYIFTTNEQRKSTPQIQKTG